MVEPHYQHLKTSSERGILILTVLPHLLLDEEVVDALQHDLLVAMDYHKPQKLVLDFHQVKALGSVAFRPVIALQRRVQELGGRLLLCGLASMVAEVFHLRGCSK